MINRIKKAFRDHIFRVEHNWEMLLQLADAPYEITAESEGLEFFVIERFDDPLMDELRRDFPRQSRTFGENFDDGCIMICVGIGTRIVGFYVIALRPYYDKDCFRIKFPAGDGHVYVFNFYVDPEYRRSKVAKVALTESFAWLHRAGYKTLTAVCRAEAQPLIRMYRHFKMTPSGRGVDQYFLLHQTWSRWTEKKPPRRQSAPRPKR